MNSPVGDVMAGLLSLSRQIGREDRRLAILGEGNTSADLGDGTWIASRETIKAEKWETIRDNCRKVVELVQGGH